MDKAKKAFQADIDATSAPDYYAFRAAGPDMEESARQAAFAAHPGLRRYDEAFDKVFAEVQGTGAGAEGRPAVWLLYNMGLVIKTPKVTFAIDIAHRQDVRLAPLLDFALVTHNHDDHVGPALLGAMNSAGKTVVSNFLDNYGALRGAAGMPGGYTRRRKVFRLGDVHIRTAPSDHNPYLKDFTTTFEITIGDWTLYHTGDSQNIARLNPVRRPDLWVVHPLCGMDITEGVRKFHPRRVAICHLCEMGHPPDKWRWSLMDGLREAARAEAAGAEAVVPIWGERLV